MPTPVEIPFPLSSAPGAHPHEAAGRLINCYAEPLGASSPRKAAWRRCPGLAQFSAGGVGGFRGALVVNGALYAAWQDGVYTIDDSGEVAFVGKLPGTKQVSWAVNNYKPTPDVQVVDADNGAYAVTSTGVQPFTGGTYRPGEAVDSNGNDMAGTSTAGNLPLPNSVCFQDGYFFWTIGSRQIFASSINGVAVNTLTKATAESRSGGYLLRGVTFKGLLFLFGTSWIEVWADVANPYPDFPYSRQGVIDRGLLSGSALAGQQEGFGNLLWVADDFGVYRFSLALQPEKVSPPDLDRLISRADPATLQAGCYVHAGHSVWTISSSDWTWEFNLSSQQWNERQSFSSLGALGRWRGVGGIDFAGQWLLGDVQSGALASIEPDLFTELGRQQLFRLESAPVQKFPSRTRIARSDFDITTGTGITGTVTANGQAPQTSISWTDDALQWSNPVLRDLGLPADGRRRVSIGPTGKSGATGRRWRIDVSDPVYVSVLGATQSTQVRAV